MCSPRLPAAGQPAQARLAISLPGRCPASMTQPYPASRQRVSRPSALQRVPRPGRPTNRHLEPGLHLARGRGPRARAGPTRPTRIRDTAKQSAECAISETGSPGVSDHNLRGDSADESQRSNPGPAKSGSIILIAHRRPRGRFAADLRSPRTTEAGTACRFPLRGSRSGCSARGSG